jgi:hypothetical protein
MEDIHGMVRLPDEVLALWGLLLTARVSPPADPAVPVCGACGSQVFEDLTPPDAVALLLKCLRCERKWILAGNLTTGSP